MVEIELSSSTCTVKVQGWHQYWSFRSELTVRRDQLESIGPVPDNRNITSLLSLRFPGVHIPWVIKAGSYYKNGEWEFWDVSNIDRSIVLELQNHDYNRLVIEVKDSEGTLRRPRTFLDDNSSPKPQMSSEGKAGG